MTARALICCVCGATSRRAGLSICEGPGCWHRHGACCRPLPVVGQTVVATGRNGRGLGELHQVTHVQAHTVWTRGLTPGGPYFNVTDFVGREIYCETFAEEKPSE